MLALVVVNEGTGFEAQRWQATLLIVAVVCGLAAFNILVGKRLAGVEMGFVVLHFVAFIPVSRTQIQHGTEVGEFLC